ncbi:hypothetical protein MUGA111182_12610 [Mucilaginibacter galii]|uniref:Uncharacterized protein n=1 Tax=Mucilaginibacter galii TaxID=2005073 RepID=A0A917JC76_9SPHI|nr:hypothetical protein [Mucilaginibacter galii]GGI51942.1 hypothetical protein GCM10011425_31540 [Mucilaginibacter galii]
MLRETVSLINHRLKQKENKSLSGGIVGKNLQIIDNGMGLLELKGDFTITIKVFDLCSAASPKLPSLLSSTKSYLQSKLKGPVTTYSANFYRYDPKKKKFNLKEPAPVSFLFNFNISVNIIQVNNIGQIRGNDFLIAVVDRVGYQFKDRYGKTHKAAGFSGTGAPSIIEYSTWVKDPSTGPHEFFHTLSLADLELPSDKNDIMYHLGDQTNTNLSLAEKIDALRYIISDITNMTKSVYQNPSYNTVNQLRTRLNDPINGISYNRSRFS